MAYSSLTDFKAYANITTSDTGDDDVIVTCLAAAQAYIDGYTHRHFEPVTETRSFDTPDDEMLYLDDDLLSVTSITNGSGTAPTSAQYVLYPPNIYPKWGIKIKASSGLTWETDSASDEEQAVQIRGVWGYSNSIPTDIALTCQSIALKSYRRRTNSPDNSGSATITGAGVVITPSDVSKDDLRVLDQYVRRY